VLLFVESNCLCRVSLVRMIALAPFCGSYPSVMNRSSFPPHTLTWQPRLPCNSDIGQCSQRHFGPPPRITNSISPKSLEQEPSSSRAIQTRQRRRAQHRTYRMANFDRCPATASHSLNRGRKFPWLRLDHLSSIVRFASHVEAPPARNDEILYLLAL
jgi:hypothetical protein